ncbi:MAG: MATE family efflux transporter [Clostridia bacterium]|nr:MATE family efflux transporter [Clostridia bacterium]
MSENRSARLGQMPMRQLVLKTSLPIMFSMLIQGLYNIVDSIFVAQYHPQALTAVSLAFPIQNLMLALSVGTGVGINSLISRRLGEGRRKEALDASHNGVFLAVLSWAVFLLFGIFFARPFFKAYTNDAQVLQMGGDYLQIVTIFSLGQFLSIAVERMMEGTGNTVYNMVTMVVGAVINIILDPLLIFGWGPFPEMGVAGAAIATVFAQTMGFFVGLYLNQTRNKELPLSFKGFRPSLKIIKDIYVVGVPSIVMQSIASVMTVLMNLILIAFGNEAVSVLGVYFKLQSFIFMPVFGLTNALVAIIGYNYGARNQKRVYAAIKVALCYSLIIMIAGMLLFLLMPEQMLGLFASTDPTAVEQTQRMIELGVVALRTISLSFLGAAIGIILSTVFQAIGNGLLSLLISICRQLVVLLPAAYFLAPLGVDAVWWSFPIAETVSLVLVLITFRWANRRYLKPLGNMNSL